VETACPALTRAGEHEEEANKGLEDDEDPLGPPGCADFKESLRLHIDGGRNLLSETRRLRVEGVR